MSMVISQKETSPLTVVERSSAWRLTALPTRGAAELPAGEFPVKETEGEQERQDFGGFRDRGNDIVAEDVHGTDIDCGQVVLDTG